MLTSLPSPAQQTIQLVNANSDNEKDSEVYVLFQAANADVESNGKPISGVANLSLPVGTVSATAAAGGTTVTSTSFQNLPASLGNMPAAPFPITFVSGSNTGATVKVTSYSSGTGVFSLATSTPVPNAQTTSDQFVVGAFSQKLSSFKKLTATITSPLSGETHPIYQVTANTLNSGVIYISYGPLTYTNGAPSIAGATVPYQTVELTTGAATTSDLTVIDYFAIPLQIQSVSNAGTSSETITDTRTFYFNLDKIQTDIEKLGATQTNNALYLGPGQEARSSATGSPTPFPSFVSYLDSLTSKTFTIAGSQNFGAANPSIVYGIDLAENYGANYDYTADISKNKVGDYLVTLLPGGNNNFYNISSGAAIPTPANFPDPKDIESITITLPKGGKNVLGYNEIIYGAILSAESFQINLKSKGKTTVPVSVPTPNPSNATITATNTTASFQSAPLAGENFIAPFNITFTSGANAGTTSQVVTIDNSGNMTLESALANTPVAGDAFTISVPYDDEFTQIYTNSIYSWVVSELLAGINFGFPDSTAGNSSASWYAGFPQQFPYGVARGKINDGFYNPWAAYFYNASDAYGFAFSDRIAPSPLMTTQTSQVFRITVLPESQLNAPLLSVADQTNNSITVTWPDDSNVTYTIDVQPPPPAANPVTQSTSNGLVTAVATGLQAGTPYTFSVQGSNSSNQTSLILPLTVTTEGSVPKLTAGFGLSVSFTWAGGAAAPYPAEAGNTVWISGVESKPMTGDPTDYTTNPNNVSIYGAAGSNLFVLDIKTAGKKPKSIFKAPFQVGLEALTGSQFQLDPTYPVQLFGQGPGSTISAQSGVWGKKIGKGPATTQLPVTISFNPPITKQFAEVEKPQSKIGKGDLSIGHRPGSFRGERIYDKKGLEQLIDDIFSVGQTESYYFRLHNRGKERSSFRLHARHNGDSSFEVRYFRGNDEVTAQVTSPEGLLVKALGRGDWENLRAEVTALTKGKGEAKLDILLSAHPHRRRPAQDAVRLRLRSP